MHAFFHYIVTFLRWAATGAVIGALCGAVGAVFAIAVEQATHLRTHTPWLVYLLPLGGLVIAGVYRFFHLSLQLGTDEIIATVRTQKKVPVLMAPAVFISTALTHLLGGSAGREGAALQLGGSLGAAVGDLVHPKADSRRIFELCGMAALFSALFGTPVTATIFVLEIIEVGRINDRALLPCMVSALTANVVAKWIGAPVEPFALASGLAQTGAVTLLQAAGIGVACAAVAVIFCLTMHAAGKHVRRLIPNEFLRAAAGGAAVILLTLLVGSQDYNGGGMHVVFAALAGEAAPEAFLLKILFTAVTLSAGFKGGEIVPSFFVGSTLGCTVAPLIGLSPALGAGLGLVGVFCGVTNAPLAAIVLSVELFGAEYLPLFGAAAGVAFMLSGHLSLYHEQRFAEPKLGHED